MNSFDPKLTRIGVFYDGNYFYHVSNYYKYTHARRARLSIPGLHEFIRNQVAEAEGVDMRYCQVVDAHYFRGRLPAHDANDRQLLLAERTFDDILMREGITTHYLPLGPGGEKGIDVWLALESFEQTLYKRFNVVVLIACDGDYLPLARKVNTLGTRVMVLGWDFKFTDNSGRTRETVTSVELLDEVSYPLLMHNIIDDKTRRNDSLINSLFVPRQAFVERFVAPPVDNNNHHHHEIEEEEEVEGETPLDDQGDFDDQLDYKRGRIQALKDGYGFIATEIIGKNMFFHHTDVHNGDFNDLYIGDEVWYIITSNERGECAKRVQKVQ
ncbi:MAG: NYN domain-containing protein [Candidatus Hydrogenedentes bacterium]|nr:NYN domain-containing protein [Candidatus Hydrogenedentota bacterium]